MTSHGWILKAAYVGKGWIYECFFCGKKMSFYPFFEEDMQYEADNMTVVGWNEGKNPRPDPTKTLSSVCEKREGASEAEFEVAKIMDG